MPQTATAPVFASAISQAPESSAAVQQILEQLGQRVSAPVDLLTIFVTAEHRADLQNLVGALREKLEAGVTVGVTVEGVVGVRRELEEGPAVSVMAARLPGITVHPFTYDQIDWPAASESTAAIRRNIAGDMTEPKVMLLLADPFSTPMVRLLPALTNAFPGLPIAGGMASSARQPGNNRLILNDQIMNQGAVGVLIGGPIEVHTVVSQGCRPIGRPYVITKAQRHIVKELGGRKAMDVIQETAETLDEADRDLLRQTPLMVGRVIDEYKDRFGRGDFLIRALMGADQDKGYVAIADPQVRVGQTIQFQLRDRKTAAEDFQLLLEAQKLHDPAAGAMLFTCNGRGTRLFDHPDADATMIADALGEVPLAGFFAAGEIGPIGQQNFVHGHTASLVVFRQG